MKKLTIAYLLTFASAVLYGLLEAFVFDHGFHMGAPNFLVFRAEYHIPMGLMALIFCRENWQLLPLWALLEDMAFFFAVGTYTLTTTSWVCMGLGGIETTLGLIPWTYLILVCTWVVLEVVKYYQRWTIEI